MTVRDDPLIASRDELAVRDDAVVREERLDSLSRRNVEHRRGVLDTARDLTSVRIEPASDTGLCSRNQSLVVLTGRSSSTYLFRAGFLHATPWDLP